MSGGWLDRFLHHSDPPESCPTCGAFAYGNAGCVACVRVWVARWGFGSELLAVLELKTERDAARAAFLSVLASSLAGAKR